MFSRALRICDPAHQDEEITHIFKTFENLGYPHFFIRNCLSKSRKRYYNPNPKKSYTGNDNNLCLPYSKDLASAQNMINAINPSIDKENSIQLSFRYRNTIRNKLVKNRSLEKDKDVGVYCIPCLDCKQCYIGESGRGLNIRLEEHRRACRLGDKYSAVATHSLHVGHRIGFRESNVVYKSQDRSTRRVVEGALISLNDTFINNKSGTKEDIYTNSLICKSIGIKDYCNISATFRIAASPLSSQVLVPPADAGPLNTGAYAVHPPEGPIPLEPPDAVSINVRPRRSARLNNP